MKERWNNLALREKQFVIIGVIIIAVFLLYEWIWSPLQQNVMTLRGKIHEQEQVLVWMQSADQRMLSLEKNIKAHTLPATTSLLGIVQKASVTSPLAKQITELKQVENNAVRLGFQKVNFDELISWLIQIWREQGLIISEASIKPSGVSGIVTAEVTLSHS